MMYNNVNGTHEIFVNIKGSYLEKLFDLVFEVYSKHGSKISRNWTDWPRLNQYYPSEILGNYIETTEDDSLKRFCNGDGSHCIYGSCPVVGDDAAALKELKEVLGLILVSDEDKSKFYPGHRIRTWQITNPQFRGGSVDASE